MSLSVADQQITLNFKKSYLPSIRKVCPSCGDSYKTYVSQNKKSCSRKCAYEFQKAQTIKRKTKHCLVCSKPFVPKHPASPGLYCSYHCSGVANRKPVVLRNGYEYVFDPEKAKNNKQGYFPMHHLIFEMSTGIKIKEGEVIHHINRVKNDNSINNLMLISDLAHKRLHANQGVRGARGVFNG